MDGIYSFDVTTLDGAPTTMEAFRMFAKVEVNGAHAHPLWAWLKSEKTGFLIGAIKWNFTKFLVGRDGTVLERFPPTAKPQALEPKIEAALE